MAKRSRKSDSSSNPPKPPVRRKKGRQPNPLYRGLIICDFVIHDSFQNKFTVVGLFNSFVFSSYPAQPAGMTIFTELTDGIGEYQIELTMERAKDAAVLGMLRMPPIKFEERMAPIMILAKIPPFVLPEPGTYDIVLRANGIEVIRSPFYAKLDSNAPRGFGDTHVLPPDAPPPVDRPTIS